MTSHAKPPERRRWPRVARTLFGLLIIAVVIVSYFQDRQRITCEQEWFVAASQAFRERSDAAGDSAREQKALLEATLSGDRERARHATEDYIAALDRAELIRRASPIPQPPEC